MNNNIKIIIITVHADKLHAFNVVLLTLTRLIEVKVTGEFEKIPNRLDCESVD